MDWNADHAGGVQGSLAVGYGLAAGTVAGLDAGQGLSAAAPAPDWLGRKSA